MCHGEYYDIGPCDPDARSVWLYAFQPQCNRSLIGQRDLHIGSELTALHLRMLQTRERHQALEQRARVSRLGRGRKSRAKSLTGIGGERELRYQK